jgi:hypothetical protein
LSVTDEPGRGLELAGWRLERALARLEARLAERLERATTDAADLAIARERIGDLELAGTAAAAALDRAIVQIREMLAREPSRP